MWHELGSAPGSTGLSGAAAAEQPGAQRRLT